MELELVRDAARSLNQPVEARPPDQRTVRLDGVEAAYLALCRKGLKGHKGSLLKAIRIMLEVGTAMQAEEQQQSATRQSVLDAFRKMGVQVPGSSD